MIISFKKPHKTAKNHIKTLKTKKNMKKHAKITEKS